MITKKSEYKHSSVSRIPVEGKVIPVLDNRVLKAEDASFLAEAAYDRASVLSGWPLRRGWSAGPEHVNPDTGNPTWHVNPYDVTGTDFSLVLAQEGRSPLPEIAKLFHAAAYENTGGGYSDAYEYMRYVDPSWMAIVHDKVLDDEEFTVPIHQGKFRTVEENLLKAIGLDAAMFASKAKNSWRADWGSRPLDLVGIRNAYSDVKNLRRLVVPCATTSAVVCDWQESEYDQDSSTGSTYSANLVVKPLPQRPTFNFANVQCFCTVPKEGDSTPTLYMSEKSIYYGEGDEDNRRSTCCADWVNVTPSGSDISLNPVCGCDKSKLTVERVYILVRAWRWNLDGMPRDTLDAKTYLASVGTSKWKIPGSVFSLGKCMEYLSKVGFPTSCARQYDGKTPVRHIAKVGVDVAGIYAFAHLKDPPVKTDIWDLGWNP